MRAEHKKISLPILWVLLVWSIGATGIMSCDGATGGSQDVGEEEDAAAQLDDDTISEPTHETDGENTDIQSDGIAADGNGDSPGNEEEAGFWPSAYDPNCIGGSSHSAGKNCMSCHSADLTFAGTVYAQTGSGAANVEVGVRDATGFVSVCSGSNGNFYLPISTSIDWDTATLHIRNDNGDITKPQPPSAACNSCHTNARKLTAP